MGGVRESLTFPSEAESTARSIFRGLIQPREIRQLGKPISLADLSAAARKIRLRDLAYAKICVIACWNMDASDDVPDRDLAWEIRRVYPSPPLSLASATYLVTVGVEATPGDRAG